MLNKEYSIKDISTCKLSVECKAIENQSGRYIEYIVASTGTDKAMGITDGKIWMGDNLTPSAIESMKSQLEGAIGSMHDPSDIKDMRELDESLGSVGTGIGHEHMLVSKDIVPVSVTEEAEVIENNGNIQLKIIDKINEYSARANDFYNMVKSRILGFASIEYKPTKYSFKEVDGVLQRFVEDVKFLGKAFTGKPANGLCGVLNLSVKSTSMSDNEYNELKSILTNEVKMAEEETKKDEKVEETPKEAPVLSSEEVKAILESNKFLQEQMKALVEEVKSVKEAKDDEKLTEEYKGIKEELEQLKAERKNLVEVEQKKFEEIKSLKDKAIEEIKSAKDINSQWDIISTVSKEYEMKGGDILSLGIIKE